MMPLTVLLLVILLFLWFGFLLGSSSQHHQPIQAEGYFPPDPEEIDQFQNRISEVLAVSGHSYANGLLSFEGKLLTDPNAAQQELGTIFTDDDFTPMLREAENDGVRVLLVPGLSESEAFPDRPRWWLHTLLFLLTLGTTTWAGAWHAGVNPVEDPASIVAGLPYGLGLLLILGAHELGHYFMARKHGIRVTPPYFIPVPFALGTFGAFIKMKSLSPNRRALFDVAVAGPIAGLVFAIPALIIGLQHSEILTDGAPTNWMHGGGVNVGSSLLMTLLSKVALGDALLEGHQIMLHPLAFAGWLGLLVTALNLMPIGQLDGGHMAHALFGPARAHSIGVASLVGLFLLAFFIWPGLLMWAILVYFIAGTRDMPPANDITPVGLPRRIVGFLTFGLLLAILLPVPHELYQTFGLHCPYL